MGTGVGQGGRGRLRRSKITEERRTEGAGGRPEGDRKGDRRRPEETKSYYARSRGGRWGPEGGRKGPGEGTEGAGGRPEGGRRGTGGGRKGPRGGQRGALGVLADTG